MIWFLYCKPTLSVELISGMRSLWAGAIVLALACCALGVGLWHERAPVFVLLSTFDDAHTPILEDDLGLGVPFYWSMIAHDADSCVQNR